MSDDPDMTFCEHRPFPHLSACIREEGHKEKHVYARGRPGSVTLYEQGRGSTFRAIYELELEPGVRIDRIEAYAFLAVAEYQKTKKAEE